MFLLQDPSEPSDWLNHPQVFFLEKDLSAEFVLCNLCSCWDKNNWWVNSVNIDLCCFVSFNIFGITIVVYLMIPTISCVFLHDHLHCCQAISKSVSPCQQWPSYSFTKHCDWSRSGWWTILFLVFVSNLYKQHSDWKSISLQALPTDPPSDF